MPNNTEPSGDSGELTAALAESLRVFVDCNFTFFGGRVVGGDRRLTRDDVLKARDLVQRAGLELGAAAPQAAQAGEPDTWRNATLAAVSHLDYESGAPAEVQAALRSLRAVLNAGASPQAERPALPDRVGVYAWSNVSSNALVLVNKRPSSHSPGGVFNGHIIGSSKFYDGCPVESWGRGKWVLLWDGSAGTTTPEGS